MSDVNGEPEFEALLIYLDRARGFDFSGYKRGSLLRRIDKRMQQIPISGYGHYQDYLEVHPEEFGRLFDTILINVTAFFRDPPAWEVLAREMVPRIIAEKRSSMPLRIWSAGCASGEEPYSLAMTMVEALGLDQFRDRVKVYATDVDDAALGKARQAAYDAQEVRGVPAELLAKYFDLVGDRFVFNKELRRSVIFGRHDLIQDAPISRVDLLACRNTLMYFNTETQARILDRFHFAVTDNGLLFLGKAETSLTYSNGFGPVDLKRRIFSKVSRGYARGRSPVLSPTPVEADPVVTPDDASLRESAFEAGTVASVVVGIDGRLTLANARARRLFGLTRADLGRPLQDLQFSYRPTDVRSCIDRAYQQRDRVTQDDVKWAELNGESSTFLMEVVPLFDSAGSLLGASISYLDQTVSKKLGEELQDSNRELESAYEELQSTNEELETTNEELQSTVEELETTNEELQSTNEELETMNEELQSINEEMETVNDELRRSGEEAGRTNDFLRSILGSLRGGVVVVDPDLNVNTWNTKAEDLWGLRVDEVRGKNLLSLDIGLPVHQLKPPIRACLSGDVNYQELTIDALTRRGKSIRCKVTCTPIAGNGGVQGAMIIMDEGEATSQ